MNSHLLQNNRKLYAALLLCAGSFAGAPNTTYAQSNVEKVGASSQRITVTGIVNDAEGPVIGASVRDKANPQTGAVTDIDGKFKVQVPGGTSELTVSFIGYLTCPRQYGYHRPGS